MNCPKCQFENPDTNKFCRKCGEKLTLTCPQCNSEYLPDDQFENQELVYLKRELWSEKVGVKVLRRKWGGRFVC
jgi:protein phosphatase